MFHLRFAFPAAAMLLAAFTTAQDAAPATSASGQDVTPVVDDQLAEKIRVEGIKNSQANRLLSDLTGKIGHRLTGSDNYTKACDWAVAEFEKMGLSNVHKEQWGEWNLTWNRGVWKGRIVEPVELDMYVATPAWTASTNGVRRGEILWAPADVEELEELGDVKGKFLYYTRRPRGAVRSACEDAGIAGWVYEARGDRNYPTRVRVFGSHRTAMGDIEDVPTIPVIAVQSDHAEQLEDLLDAAADGGKPVVCEFQVDSEFRDEPIALYNVIAEIPGTSKPDEVVIVCGHLDSWHQAQGCTDNGTGTASTMEAARILMAVGAKPERTIRFCLWGGEEQGLLGSAAYVRQHRNEMDKVSAVFNHDTGTNWAAALTVAETMYEPMQRVFLPVMKMVAPDEDHEDPVFVLKAQPTISGGGGSDHASFIAAGVPGLNWTLRGRSDYFGYTWHSQWDTIDVAIDEYQRHTSTVIALAALGTANLPDILDRSGVSRRGGRGRRSQGSVIAGALFGAELDGMKFTKIQEDGNAAKMGVKTGDVLWKVNGTEIERIHEIFQVSRGLDPEVQSVTLLFKRGDSTFEAKLDMGTLRSGRGGRGNRPRRGGGEGRGGRRGGGGDGGR
ncbi:MAG: M20/M25/M40 family metallo-hydrolase [Planctomycetota bacterium]|nr:M20/M25/M40 family metallo-hydrolase [Planctomycetota bacterium]